MGIRDLEHNRPSAANYKMRWAGHLACLASVFLICLVGCWPNWSLEASQFACSLDSEPFLLSILMSKASEVKLCSCRVAQGMGQNLCHNVRLTST